MVILQVAFWVPSVVSMVLVLVGFEVVVLLVKVALLVLRGAFLVPVCLVVLAPVLDVVVD